MGDIGEFWGVLGRWGRAAVRLGGAVVEAVFVQGWCANISQPRGHRLRGIQVNVGRGSGAGF